MDSRRGLPILALFQKEGETIEIKTRDIGAWEPLDFDIRRFTTDDNVYEIFADIRPQVIVSVGKDEEWKGLMTLPFEERRKWISFDPDTNPVEIGEAAYRVFINAATSRSDKTPLISIFTPVYRTGEKLMRPFNSLINSIYKNWEWIIFDDSDDNNETWDMLVELSNKDQRIKIFRGRRNSGRVGETKFYAANLCQGQVVLELDHDDELTENALEWIAKAYKKYPDAGFYYTDCTEIYEENGKSVIYGEGFAMGYGSYKVDWYKGRSYLTHISCNINPRTIRHIVGVPNHIRAWRADVYKDILGHSTLLGVCDDYEIIIRTFLKTKFVRIAQMGYIQWMNAGGDNTQNYRRQEIQRLVRFIRQRYDREIHERFVELGVHDDAWSDELGWCANLWTDKPKQENLVNYVFDPLSEE